MPEGTHSVEDVLHEPPTVEDWVRDNIKAVLAVTDENLTDIGVVLDLSVAVVGRRQRGVTPWSVAELGKLARHWRIEAFLLFSRRTADVLAALPPKRIAQLRAVKVPSAITRPKAPVAA
ncbi:helix-turn-helix domain-containing protein [Streptomyces lydicus]|uniref:helix-turn-helix domain-containing protein n=1 Tax=Streptomyces lydicus TaxID=47763 RepID=UPI0010122E12|nr:helix-turn-helix domain-containing protein [Streptomyces lydicus]MCZ1011951.1 helix-turn-helix domain-containing protein [Streptomyces lydicus]